MASSLVAALVAAGLVVSGLALTLPTILPEPSQHYSLVIDRAEQEYVLDHGLSLDDCATDARQLVTWQKGLGLDDILCSPEAASQARSN